MNEGISPIKPRVLVVCARRYNGHELWTLLGVLQNRGVDFEVVSQDTLIRDELSMRPNKIKRKVHDVPVTEMKEWDGITVVSGNMADTELYWKDLHVESLLKEARLQDKVCAAICCSVPTLAPIVGGIKVSFFPLVRSRQRLQHYGAILRTVSLTVDKRTVTAENQMITEMWAEEIAHMLHKPDQPPLYSFNESDFTPKGFERKMPPEVRKVIDEARGYPMVIRKKPKTKK